MFEPTPARSKMYRRIKHATSLFERLLQRAWNSVSAKIHMSIKLIKARARRDHFHRDDQIVCERCMSKLASSGSLLYDEVSEYFYVTRQLLCIFVQCIVKCLFWLLASVLLFFLKPGSACLSLSKVHQAHMHKNGQQFWEKRLTNFCSFGSPFVDTLGDYIYTVREILMLLAKFVLFVSLGIGICVAAIFPAVTGRKSAHEEELDSRFRARKQREWEERQRDIEIGRAYDEARDQELQMQRTELSALKQKRAAWTDALDKQWQKKVQEDIARDQEEFKKFQKNRDKINSASFNSARTISANEPANDDDLVMRTNNRLRGVESGVEDPEDLRRDTDEVLRHRQDTAANDARRRELQNRYKDRDWEAHRLMADGDRARKQGKNDEADHLYRQAKIAQSEAGGLYSQFLSV